MDQRSLDPTTTANSAMSRDAYSHLTLEEAARSEYVSPGGPIEDVRPEQPSADNIPPDRAEHREASAGHRESPEQRLALHTGVFDVRAEVDQLQREPAWTDGDQNAKTLVKKPDLRIVLMILKQGARLDEHVAQGSISIHALYGRMRVAIGDSAVELDAGKMLALDGGVRHDVQALEASAFLLTLAR